MITINRLGALVMTGMMLAAGGVSATETDCADYLLGQWAGTGTMGKTELESAYSFGEDGRFETISRFRSPGKDWTEQVAQGSWTVVTDPARPEACHVTLLSEFDMGGVTGSTKSTVTYMRVDEASFSNMGFLMQRQPAAETATAPEATR